MHSANGKQHLTLHVRRHVVVALRVFLAPLGRAQAMAGLRLSPGLHEAKGLVFVNARIPAQHVELAWQPLAPLPGPHQGDELLHEGDIRHQKVTSDRPDGAQDRHCCCHRSLSGPDNKATAPDAPRLRLKIAYRNTPGAVYNALAYKTQQGCV